MTPPLVPSNIHFYLTGGSSNTNPNLSLGGNISTSHFIDNVLHNLFRQVIDSELSSGITLYRCIALKNDNTTETMRNPVVYLVTDTISTDDLALYSFAQAAKNTAETTIPNETTTPTGSKINFIAALNRSGGLDLPDLAPGEYVNIWLRISVEPSSRPFPENSFKIRVESDSSGGGSGPPEDPDTGISFSLAVTGDCSCNSNFDSTLSRMKARNPTAMIFNGDNAYSSGSTCFTNKIGSTWQEKTIVSFGNHDVDEDHSQPATKNQLLNFFSLPRTYYAGVIGNMGFVVMESGSDQSVSDAVGSAQYVFIEASLAELKSISEVEWIMVFNHYPFYGPTSEHGNNGGGRDRYDTLFDTYGVDAVFTSHNHNMWSSKLLKYNSGSPSNPVTAGTDPNYSYNKATANHGKLYFGIGAGGRSHYDIESTPSYVVFTNDNDYGYILMEFSGGGKVCTFKFYRNNDSLLKTVTLTHL